MSAGPQSNTLAVAVDFRLPLQPPNLDPTQHSPELRSAVTDIWNCLLQVQQAFNTTGGVGARPQAQQSLLAGSPDTVQSGNLNRMYVIGGIDMPQGTLINLFDFAGNTVARPADAANATTYCQGYVSDPNGLIAGQVGEVMLANGIIPTAGLVKGSTYYLAVGGGVTTVAPVAAGNIEQLLGPALTATKLLFAAHHWIQH